MGENVSILCTQLAAQRRDLVSLHTDGTITLGYEHKQLDEGLSALVAQAKQAAVNEERQRLARELHDVVTQMLHTATWMAETLPHIWERDAAEGRHGLEELRQVLLEAVAEMRALLLDLRPAAMMGHRLGALLPQLADAMSRHARIHIGVVIEEHHQLPPDLTMTLYRITQEALNNAIRHARASQIMVHLQTQPHEVVVRIEDNGCGFDPQTIPSDHFGLAMMRERAASVGAVVEVQSSPGKGTQVVVTWAEAGKTAD